MLARVLAAVMGAAARRPVVVGAGVLALALAGAGLALRLEPSAQTSTVVGTSTSGYAATQRLYERFGDDPVYVMVREPLTRVVLTQDLDRVLGLEGCIAGNVPPGEQPYGGASSPCGRLARTRPARVVFGPGTFLNTSVSQIADQLALALDDIERTGRRAGDAARKRSLEQGLSRAEAERNQAAAKAQAEQRAQRPLLELARFLARRKVKGVGRFARRKARKLKNLAG